MAIVLLIVGISLLILIHEMGHFFAAKYFGLLVEEFGIGFPPRLFKIKKGETVYSINLLPFGGFVRIHGEKKPEKDKEENKERSFWYLPIWKRSTIIVAGVAMNFILGWVLISTMFIVGAPTKVIVADVLDNTPAAAAGIMAGDRILELGNGEAFYAINEVKQLIGLVNDSKGKEISLKLLRGDEEMVINNIVPRIEPPEKEGALGIALSELGIKKHGIFAGIWNGLISSFNIIGAIFTALANLILGIFTGGAVLENFVGPVGIFQIAGQAAEFGLIFIIQLIALISLNLAVLNIIPIPALDGGRLLFLIIEKIKGSPVSGNKEMWAHAVGFIVLILLMVVITARDIINLF